MGLILGVNKNGDVTVLERNVERKNWTSKANLKISKKNEIIGIGVVPCEKAIFFSQVDLCVWPYNSDKVGKNKNFSHLS